MSKYLLRGALALLTFIVGLSFVALLFSDLFRPRPIAEPAVISTTDQGTPTTDQNLSFQPWGPIADGSDFSGPASFTSFKASDGEILDATLIYGISNENIARKRFRFEIRHSSKVIEQSDFRAIIVKDARFGLVEWGKNPGDSDHGFSVLIINAPSLKHLIDFERQEKAFATSLRIDRFQP